MSLAPGSQIGDYRVVESLGRGGMATVYRAYEARLDRHVALKVLPPALLHEAGFAERFEREARVVALLEHPHIVPIYAYGIHDGVPWMAMRLVAGGTLAERLADGPLALARGIPILEGVARALDYAHQRGVLHRDVKPQNVLVDGDDHAYLADFGIAKLVEGHETLTKSGVVSGTPHYMAPEQGSGGTVDARTDVYALGVIAYQMVSGKVPFSADTPVATMVKHLTEPVPVPDRVPRAVIQPILKGLAKKPDDRWPSAGAFLVGLKATRSQEVVAAATLAAATRTIAAVPTSETGARVTVGEIRRPVASAARPQRGLWALLAIVALIGAVALGVGRARRGRTTAAAPVPTSATSPPTSTPAPTETTPPQNPSPGPEEVSPTPESSPAPRPTVDEELDARCRTGEIVACDVAALLAGRGLDAIQDLDRAMRAVSRACREDNRVCIQAITVFRGSDAATRRALLDVVQRNCDQGDAVACQLATHVQREAARGETPTSPSVAQLRSACDAGDANACAMLADRYRRGDGVERDRVRALGLLDRACAGGHREACRALERLKR